MNHGDHSIRRGGAFSSPVLQYVLLTIFLLPIYWLGGVVGLYLRASFGDVTPIWPPSGLAVALFIGRGVKYWPVPFFGELLIALWDRQPWAAGIIGGTAQSLEALLAMHLLRKMDVLRFCESSISVIKFTIFGAMIPPLIGSFIGSVSLYELGRLAARTLWEAIAVWWIGDAIGILVLAPVLLEFTRLPLRETNRRTVCKFVFLLLAMAVAGVSVITNLAPRSEYFFFLLLAFVVVATIRFGMCGATASTLIMTAIVYGLRPENPPDADLVTTVRMLFVGISTFTAYLIAGFLREREVAERRLHEMNESMQRAQKIQALGTLAGGIAHDFNNIVTTISGFTELALKLHLDDKKSLAEDLEQIQVACRRATDLTRQILSFSRPCESKIRETNIVPVFDETIRLFRSALPKTISLEIHKDVQDARTLCNDTQIHQILINLLTNAMHALPNCTGKIDVRMAEENVTAEQAAREHVQPGRYILLSVSDTGIGMSPEVVERIFDPYFSTKPPGQGTGLGLSVVQGIVRELGGFIRVESAPGKGTTMRIYLPRVPSDRPKGS